MAEVQKTKGAKKPLAGEKEQARHGTLSLRRSNVLVLVAGMVVILLGYFLLSRGSISMAPILLVVGYCVIVPLAIVLWTRKPDGKPQSGTGE
jgi:uncharacterized membrane protein